MSNTDKEIHILPDVIANQIAAGEVVQRPESVVKELVENSLDAGASEIIVIVRGAGKQLLHVIDNGKGMSRADIELAPQRHATSKITTAEDLARITTLGFRGEALASICSVAQVEIRTRRHHDEHGWRLLSEPLQPPIIEPCSMQPGTHILVRNLFYNVPARRKFLRSDLTEFRHIADTMMRLALSRPDVRFVLYDDDTLQYDLAATSLYQRIADIFGRHFAETLMRVDHAEPLAHGSELRITGYIGQPQFAKRSKSEQFLTMNGRVISSRQISHAVISAYEHLLDQSNYPPFILNIALDPERVDVNIHPQKHEVKFDDDRTIYTAVRRAVAGTLSLHNLAPSVQFDTANTQAPQHDHVHERIVLSSRRFEQHDMHRASPSFSYRQQSPIFFHPLRPSVHEQSTAHFKDGTLLEQGTSTQALFKTTNIPSMHSIEQQTVSSAQSLASTPLWQLHAKYIVMSTADGIALIDQHAAHERILYERALKAMNEGWNYGQDLLFPIHIHLPHHDRALLQELLDDIRRLGFDVLPTPEGAEIRSVPADVRTGQEEESLRDLLEQYRSLSEVRHTSIRDNLAASFGCRAAIRSGDSLTLEEMQRLVHDLYTTHMPYTCPHGRPIILEISLEELDRRFGRSS
ncbi:MAG: DNA mismatch repair endonuclease MutL [Bacteroidota bacterium]|nr:DNA mismatch repair endonuclease MutL [Candidatus Kapabacteria bacterium]MDW8219844.1 DNA mismatch repair endonuclease MutL [Bacteroidota bacterium]